MKIIDIYNASLIIVLLIVYVACSKNPDAIEENKKPFRQYATHELAVHGGLLYAATDSGLYRKPVEPESTQWESLGLAHAAIRSFLVFSENEILASANFGEGNPKTTIAKTIDGGETWVDFRNGYSGNVNDRVPSAMAKHPEDPNILYAGGPGAIDVAKSKDRGKSWDLVSGSWQNLGFLFFVKINPKNPRIIFTGGSNAIFQPYLNRTKNAGLDWENLSESLQIFENVKFEADANDMIINKQQTTQLLLGLDIGIFYSEDEGASWDTVFTGASIRTFANSEFSDETVFASGRNADRTPFYLKSADFGDTWQEFEIPGLPNELRVNDMVAVEVAGSEVLYFGTNKGVYSYVEAN